MPPDKILNEFLSRPYTLNLLRPLSCLKTLDHPSFQQPEMLQILKFGTQELMKKDAVLFLIFRPGGSACGTT